MNVKELEQIQLLISRELAGEATEEERSKLNAWVTESAENKKIYTDTKKTWQLVNKPELDKIDVDVEKEWEIFQSTIQSKKEGKVVPFRIPLSRIAAVVLLAFAAAAVFYYLLPQAEVYESDRAGYVVTLPDQSTVTLNRASTLTVESGFHTDHRNVTLTGEAFFEIEKASHPFVVSLYQGKVEVVGTSFNIRSAYGDNKSEVIVASGRVTFSASNNGESMQLGPGDKVTVHENGQVEKTTNDDGNYRSWATRTVVFDDHSLAEVVSTLNNMYEKQVLFDVPVPDCIVTASFEHQDLRSVLNVLSTTLDFSFEERDSAFVVTKISCQ